LKESITLDSEEQTRVILGVLDQNIKKIEALMGVELFARGRQIKIKGDQRSVQSCKSLLFDLVHEMNRGGDVSRLLHEKTFPKETVSLSGIKKNYFKLCAKEVVPKSKNQLKYIKAIQHYNVVFGIGPAGTGKTYLAMACAVESFRAREVDGKRINRNRTAGLHERPDLK